MVKSELIKRSPIRVLDSSTDRDSGKGFLAALMAAPGVGKTSALIHIAIDKLLQDKPVIHVAFSETPTHVIEYYKEIFVEISKVKNLEKAMDVHDQIVRNRMVMTFDPRVSSVAHILEALRSGIKEGNLAAETVIIDKYDFSQATLSDLKLLREYAKKHGMEVWFSVSQEQAETVIPKALEPYFDLFSVAIHLKPSRKDHQIHLQLIKDHGKKLQDMHLLLDPKTLLIVKE